VVTEGATLPVVDGARFHQSFRSSGSLRLASNAVDGFGIGIGTNANNAATADPITGDVWS
jgi:hypothetical protein